MRAAIGLLIIASLTSGCRRADVPPPEPTSPASSQSNAAPDDLRIKDWVMVEDFAEPLAQFETVFWEPRDTTSLRQMIRETDLVKDKTVLEIGTGTGLISLCCLQAGARRVVATDVNRAAVANALYNADRLGLAERFDVRQVPLDDTAAFAVIRPDERFDLIVSNPPWEDAAPESIDQYALYDPGFELLKSLLAGAPEHLEPGGRLLLAYGCVDAVRTLEQLAESPNEKQPSYELTIHDDRSLDSLPPVFLPGMLIELRIAEVE